jgi:hypothetical protein
LDSGTGQEVDEGQAKLIIVPLTICTRLPTTSTVCLEQCSNSKTWLAKRRRNSSSSRSRKRRILPLYRRTLNPRLCVDRDRPLDRVAVLPLFGSRRGYEQMKDQRWKLMSGRSGYRDSNRHQGLWLEPAATFNPPLAMLQKWQRGTTTS